MAERSYLGRLPHGWLTGFREIGNAIVSVLFPAPCRICEQLLVTASRVPICGSCLASFETSPEQRCEICGLPMEEYGGAEGESLRCGACRRGLYAFERARSFGIYDEGLTKAILLLKFEEMEPLAMWFSRRLADLVRAEGETLAADVVVPVPLHKDRYRERGYNQAELLSKRVAKLLGLPHRGVLLVRTKPRPDKHLLTERERWETVRGAFATRTGSRVDNLRVLLLDDVMTTGATLDACTRALLDAGAKSVVGVTVARARSMRASRFRE